MGCSTILKKKRANKVFPHAFRKHVPSQNHYLGMSNTIKNDVRFALIISKRPMQTFLQWNYRSVNPRPAGVWLVTRPAGGWGAQRPPP